MSDIANGQANFTTHPTPGAAALIFASGTLVLGCGWVSLYGWPASIPAESASISFLNVGQGDSILIQTPTTNVLIDGGPDDVVLDELDRVLPVFSRHLNLVMASHSDADHIGGFPSVLARYTYDVFAGTGIPKKSAIRNELNTMIASSTVWNLEAGDRIVLDPYNEIFLDVLWPPANAITATEADGNEMSLVTRLQYSSSSALLTGDVGIPTEKELIRCFGTELFSTILKVGHHGSDSSTSQEFVSAVAPKVAVISAGTGNSYGHPHQSVIETLSRTLHSQNIHITKDEGRVTFVLSKAGIALFP